ncbi:MAG: dihydrofolate reductase family protein [Bacteroidia bacterium]|nr:dihydrofolate reductase family protein [Bacteroidia bacterium]
MRKLKLQIQMSVDGFIAGPNGEMDWMTWNWDDKLKEYVGKLTENVDCILLGRKLAEGFIPHWAAVAEDAEDPEQNSGKFFTETPKVVFTQSSGNENWKNTVLAKNNLTEEVMSLKKEAGKDLIVYGGGKFVSSLIQHRLIDEYHFFVNPAIIGKGMQIFSKAESYQRLKLIQSTAFECGIVVLHYGLNQE